MSATTLIVKDGTGTNQSLSVTTDASNASALVGTTSITDPATGAKVALSSAVNLNGGVAVPFTVTQPNALITVKPGMWSVTASGAAGTGATAVTTTPGAGKVQVIDSITCGVTADGTGAAQASTFCQVTQDIGGTPLVLWQSAFSFLAGAANAGGLVTISGLNIPGTVANKTLTISFVGAAAPSLAVAAHTITFVNMSGYTVG